MSNDKKIENEISFENKSKTSSIIGGLLLVFCLVVYVFLLRPLNSDIQNVQANISSKNQEVSVLKQELDDFQTAERELDLATEVQRIESIKAVPVSMKQDDVIRDIITIARENDVSLTSISFGKGGTRFDGIGVLNVNASFEGNYRHLTNFLRGLEQNARLFKVNSISVQVRKMEISGVERASFSLSIESFFQN